MATKRIGKPMSGFPQETQRYSCTTGPGSDTHGQSPPTDAQPISQHKQLAGDPVSRSPRTKLNSRQYNRGY